MIKCSECGSTNVEARAWVNCNTLEFIDWCDDGENWCDDCQEYTEVEDDEQ